MNEGEDALIELAALLRNERRKWLAWFTAQGLVFLLAAGGLFVLDHRDDQRGCLRGNETRSDIREAINETLILAVSGSSNPEAGQAFIERNKANLLRILPDRDC